METLSQLLESLQNDMLTLYEKDSDRLTDQITHWHLNRKEQTLYYGARQRGITRIGYNHVPSLAASQQRAKQAIEQELILRTLLDSEFGEEPWNLMQTSRERLLAPPAYCFKKGGHNIDVKFNNDSQNIARYVLWDFIYYQDSEDKWRVSKGYVDETGLYYETELGIKIYYVNFHDEAAKYGNSDVYEVVKTPLTTPVSTSTSGLNTASPGPHSDSGTPRRKTSTPVKSRKKSGRHALPKTPVGRRFGRRKGERVSTATPSSKPPSPEQIGSSHQSVPVRGGGGRLGRLLAEARDPPCIVIRGDPNTVKCLRYRFKQQYQNLFWGVSTTWSWTWKGSEQSKRSRIIFLFTDDDQREKFLNTVKLPKSVSYFLGSFNDY
ncbi:E2 protein [Crocuta crocuta papillomavirus 1]|uniref:Regulatory protein E2 n=1 Tax=Crocuta crocuta papillomavirus 1 TaxID=1104917 RepID=J7F1F4_9PAPI|nr:E2 protein [Crocuta crocuta papillomavirus 1]AER38250.1 E2 protein [Crocuta crocuta papillomavirus 1]